MKAYCPRLVRLPGTAFKSVDAMTDFEMRVKIGAIAWPIARLFEMRALPMHAAKLRGSRHLDGAVPTLHVSFDTIARSNLAARRPVINDVKCGYELKAAFGRVALLNNEPFMTACEPVALMGAAHVL